MGVFNSTPLTPRSEGIYLKSKFLQISSAEARGLTYWLDLGQGTSPLQLHFGEKTDELRVPTVLRPASRHGPHPFKMMREEVNNTRDLYIHYHAVPSANPRFLHSQDKCHFFFGSVPVPGCLLLHFLHSSWVDANL